MRKFWEHSSGPALEFWDMTPWEAQQFIEAKTRQRVIVAWDHGRMAGLAAHAPKKFPRSIKDLFPEDVKLKPMTPDDLFGRMMAISAAHNAST